MVVSIVNYAKYQDYIKRKNDTKTETKTKQKRNRNDTINKNVKNDKNEKKELHRSSKMTVSAFTSFWIAYPKKIGKKPAQEKFSKLDSSLLDKIIQALEAQKKTEQWIKGFIPNPLTWLNQERWEDEVEEATIESEMKALLNECKKTYGVDGPAIAFERANTKYGLEEAQKYKALFV